VIFSVGSSEFGSLSNARLILLQISLETIIAIGATAALICNLIDVSFGAVMGLCSAVTAVLITNLGLPVWVGVVGGIASGVLVGGVNGLAATRLHIPPFIATLAMLFVAQGVSLELTGSNSIPIASAGFQAIAGNYLGPFPLPVVYMLVAVGLAWLWLRYTVSGAHVYEVGSSDEAARALGVRVQQVQFGVLTLQGACAGVAGVLLASRLAAAAPETGTNTLLEVIAAVVVGGTSLFGGRGSVVGTLLGMVFVGILANGMVMINVSPNFEFIVMGLFILGAVWLQQTRERR
jgi:ribose transport system permease protein